jgi:N-acetylmuramoyl-L-alanine amidase
MQTALTTSLSPHSRRTAKKAQGIYLMEHITCPGILIECGFLSNPAEEQKLLTEQYQKQLAAVMAAVLARYADGQI